MFRTKCISHGNPDYRREPKTEYFCMNCQRDINPEKPHRIVRVVDGGGSILHPEDNHLFDEAMLSDSDLMAGDCGAHPIGNDCAKRFGLEWSVTTEE